MTITEVQSIVNNNINIQADSFFYLLHEKDKYVVSKFDLFIEALNIVIAGGELSKRMTKEIIHLYSCFHRAIIHSMDPSDLAELELPDEWREHLEEFDIAVNRIFQEK